MSVTGRMTGAVVGALALVAVMTPAATAQGGGGFGDSGSGDLESGATGGDNPSIILSVFGEDAHWGSTWVDPCTRTVYADGQEAQDVFWQWVNGMGPIVFTITTGDDLLLNDDDLFDHPWMFSFCPLPNGAPGQVIYATEVGARPPNEWEMLESVLGLMQLPLPTLVFSPDDGDFQITGVETWMWLPGDQTRSRTVSRCLPGGWACASLTATYEGLAVDMGDGTPVFACGDLRPYDLRLPYEDQADLSHCGHVFEQRSDGRTHDVVATLGWDLVWSCRWDTDGNGTLDGNCVGATGPNLGPAGRTGAPVPLEVRDIQAEATAGA